MIKKSKILFSIFIILICICTSANAMTIVLDPGHGGSDVGAVSDDGSDTYERDVNLKIARYLKEYLSEYKDVKVLLTHDGFASGEVSVFDRAMIARNNKADLFVSLHNNSSESSDAKGAEIYVTANTSLPKYKEETTKLANKVLDNLSALKIKNRGVKTRLIPTDESDVYSDGTRADYYGIIRYAMRGCHIDDGVVWGGTPANVEKGEGVPTILIEHCFMKGSDFTNFLNSDSKIKQIAIADGKAIVEHYGLKKKTEEVDNISLDKEEYTILKGNTMTLTAQLSPLTAKCDDLQWSSSNKKIATVDENGIVTAIKKGTATITVSSAKNKKSASMTVNVTELPEGEEIKIENLDNNNEYISKIEPGTTVAELKENIVLSENLYMEITDSEGNIIEDNSLVGTNINIVIKQKESNEVIQNLITILYGDVDGDGEITSRDLYKIQRHILKKSSLNSAGKNAGNLEKNGGDPTSRDLYKIQRHILKKSTIKQ